MDLNLFSAGEEILMKTERKVEIAKPQKSKKKLFLCVWLDGTNELLDRLPSASIKLALHILNRWRTLEEETTLSSTTAKKVGISQQSLRGFRERLPEMSDWFEYSRPSELSATRVRPTKALLDLMLKV